MEITGKLKLDLGFLFQADRRFKDLPSYVQAIDEASTKEISVFIKTIMAGAIFLDASDLHLEAEENGGALRIRIDGLLQNVYTFSFVAYQSLISRIKLLSQMKLNIEKKPQDGRFTVIIENNETGTLLLTLEIHRVNNTNVEKEVVSIQEKPLGELN